ncbi:MAG: aminoacyl-tRNA hydrolase [Nevskiaceae bacterium]|nr:MAG: aminoacyl-tRNA hydrolase [Nevskiaceae bacterium]TBR75112.1 MAG: aminoacyl-tRNA hydrolase [Nevskiaceae bacterium]
MAGFALRAVVGLGNPGADYARTRHNMGFLFADRLAAAMGAAFRAEKKFHGELARGTLAGTELLVLKPDTFMNSSGDAVQPLLAFYKITPQELLVVHDDLDLPIGSARLKMAGGHGGHNGLRSIHQHIGENYARLRIGIAHPVQRAQVINYVLGRPNATEQQALDAALDAGLAALETLLARGWDRATQQLHTAVSANA